MGADRADRVAAALLGGGCLALYLATLCPTVFWYNSAEFATAAVTLDVPHPPGYPLYTLLAHAFTYLPLEPARAVNLMSAVFGASAVTLAYALLRRLRVGRPGAAVGAALLGLGKLFWFQAVIAEVYTTALATLLVALLLLERGLARGAVRPIAGAAAFAGLGLGVHLSIATCGLGLALLAGSAGLEIERVRDLRRILSRERLARRLRIAGIAAAAALGGALIFLTIPIRELVAPTPGREMSVWESFRWHVTGGNYGDLFDDPRGAAETLAWLARTFADQLTWPGLALAAAGLAAALGRTPRFGAALLLIAAGNVGFFFDYNVHDKDVFFLCTTLVLCLAAGFGADEVVDRVRRTATPGRQRLLARATATAALAVPVLAGVGHYRRVDMSGFTEARDWADEVATSLPRGAVIVSYTTPIEWKYDAVFGAYYRKVVGARRDVRLVEEPTAAELGRLVQRGPPTYLYAPIDHVARGSFVVEPEGPLYRIVGVRRRPTAH